MTRGTSYKFSPLKRSIIRPMWTIWHNSSLENPIGVRLVALERGHRGLPQVTISELDDPKLQRYIRGNIELLQSEERRVYFFKCLLKLGLKIYLKEFKGHSRALLSVTNAPRKKNANT